MFILLTAAFQLISLCCRHDEDVCFSSILSISRAVIYRWRQKRSLRFSVGILRGFFELFNNQFPSVSNQSYHLQILHVSLDVVRIALPENRIS